MAQKEYELAIWKYVGDNFRWGNIPRNTRSYYNTKSVAVKPGELFVSRLVPDIGRWAILPSFCGYSLSLMFKYPYLERLLLKSRDLPDKSIRLSTELQLLSPDKITFTIQDEEITINAGETTTQESLKSRAIREKLYRGSGVLTTSTFLYR